MIHEHEIKKTTPTKVYVHQTPKSGNVMGFYRTREGGTYVLDRRRLEEGGRHHTQYGATQTSFYLDRADVEEVETPDEGDGTAPASEPDLRPVPVEALEGTIVEHFGQIVSGLDAHYDGALSNRLLFETSLRQSLVDFHVHGKDSPLMQQLDSISMTRGPGATEPDLRPVATWFRT